MELILFQFVFYSLGGIGLFAIGAIPFRMIAEWKSCFINITNYAQIASIITVFIVTNVLIIFPLIKLCNCLLGYHCSANAAGGWINASYIGLLYICFEIVLFLLKKIFKKSVK